MRGCIYNQQVSGTIITYTLIISQGWGEGWGWVVMYVFALCARILVLNNNNNSCLKATVIVATSMHLLEQLWVYGLHSAQLEM